MTDRQKIAAEWAARGLGCNLWTDSLGQRWEDFAHATDGVVIVLEGEMGFEVEGEVHHPQRGEELFRLVQFTRRGTSAARRLGGCTDMESRCA